MSLLPNKVLIIDDSPNDIHVLLEQIGSHYQVMASTSAESAIKKMQEGDLPDIILMDVNMPGLNGYEACEIIKANTQLKDIEIIFISANANPEEIIKGIDVGAIDYIVKPFHTDIIQSKLRRALEYSQDKIALIRNIKDANSMVYSVMTEAGNMGLVLNFLRQSFEITTPRELLENALDTLSQSSLKAIVFFKKQSIEEIGSNDEEPGFLEMDLIDRVLGSETPLLEKDRRLLVTRGGAVIYIKNMPDDATKSGMLKDSLMILIDGINSKLNALWAKSIYKQRGSDIARIVEDSNASLSEIRQKQLAYKQKSITILDEMVKKVEEHYYAMGLTDEQEIVLSELMNNAVTKALDHFDLGLSLDKELQSIVDKLSIISQDDSQN